MSIMGWAGHDERKLLDGRVALEMPLKSCSVVQNKSRLVAKRSNQHNNEMEPQKKRADRHTRRCAQMIDTRC